MSMDYVFAAVCLGSVAVWAVYRVATHVSKTREQRRRDRRWAAYQTEMGIAAERLSRGSGVSFTEAYEVLTKIAPYDVR